MRTIVDLPEDQVKALAALCIAQGISRAEAVRRAVARLLAEERRPGREQAFGAWRGKQGDSTAMIRGLRDEWQR
ncbi:MAG: CopG family transcriptional regulator [Planctomycetia bacterium]